MPGGFAIAHPMTLVVGVLMLSVVQASDIADGSKNHGLLPEYIPFRSESSEGFIGKSLLKPGCF